jgi:tripeptidyl-peptidase I
VRTMGYAIPEELVGHVKTVVPTTGFTTPNFRTSKTGQGRSTSISASSKGTTESQIQRRIDSSCSETITPQCLEDLYGIPTKPVTNPNLRLAVPAYNDEFANREDLKVYIPFYLGSSFTQPGRTISY